MSDKPECLEETLRGVIHEKSERIAWLEVDVSRAGKVLITRDARIAELEVALKFYRDEWDGHPGDSGLGGNYPADPDGWPTEDLRDDGGNIARAALNGETGS